jgi:cytochrome P450
LSTQAADTTLRPTLAADFDLVSQAYLRNPYELMARAQRECPVFYYPPLDFWMVTRYEDVVAVLADWQTFSSRAYRAVPVPPALCAAIPPEQQGIPAAIIDRNFVNIDPPSHTAERKKAQKTFTRKLIAQSEENVRRIANELIDGFIADGRCDLMQDFSYRLSLGVIVAMIGIPVETLPRFRDWIDDFFSLMAPAPADGVDPAEVTLPVGELGERYARVAEANAFFTSFLEQRRREPAEDLATAMVQARNEDGTPAMSDTQIIAHLLEITAAGGDTTANLIGLMVRQFTREPELLAEVRREPALWEAAIEEGLRINGIASHQFRITTREVTIGGVTIPAGAKVAAHLPAANTDAERFPDPLRFDLHRANIDEHVAFGLGRHFCMGAPLARLESRSALEELYRRIPDIRADLDEPLEYVPAVTLRGLRHLAASWERP